MGWFIDTGLFLGGGIGQNGHQEFLEYWLYVSQNQGKKNCNLMGAKLKANKAWDINNTKGCPENTKCKAGAAASEKWAAEFQPLFIGLEKAHSRAPRTTKSLFSQ